MTGDLSSKERRRLALCADGESDMEVADRNGVTRHAIRYRFRNIYKKRGARNRAHTVHLAHHSRVLR